MSVPAADRIIATAGGIAGAVLAAAGRPAWAALAVLAGVAVGVIAADLRERRIPTPLVAIGTIAAAVVGAITSARDETWAPLVHGAAGAVIVGAAFLVVHLVQPRSLGFGDVRLAALTGALTAYGTASITGAAAAAALSALVASIATLATGARSVPFGPYLLAGSAVAVLVSIPQ
jgi:leader peptidase (prepilin peptidase) / N-methyltransferase